MCGRREMCRTWSVRFRHQGLTVRFEDTAVIHKVRNREYKGANRKVHRRTLPACCKSGNRQSEPCFFFGFLYREEAAELLLQSSTSICSTVALCVSLQSQRRIPQ